MDVAIGTVVKNIGKKVSRCTYPCVSKNVKYFWKDSLSVLKRIKVASDLGLGGGFRRVFWFHATVTTG